MSPTAPKYFSMGSKNWNLMLNFRVSSLGLLQAVQQEHEVFSQKLVKCHCGPCMSSREFSFLATSGAHYFLTGSFVIPE